MRILREENHTLKNNVNDLNVKVVQANDDMQRNIQQSNQRLNDQQMDLQQVNQTVASRMNDIMREVDNKMQIDNK